MFRPRDLTIRSKMLLLAVTSAAVALTLAAIAVYSNDVEILRRSKIEQLESQARMLAFNSTAILTFRDEAAAKELLGSLVLQPSVECACFRDAAGQLLADYRASRSEGDLPRLSKDGHHFTEHGHLEIQRTVHDEDEVVGTLHLRASMSDYYYQLRQQSKAMAFMMIVGAGRRGHVGLFPPESHLASYREVIESRQCDIRQTRLLDSGRRTSRTVKPGGYAQRSTACWTRLNRPKTPCCTLMINLKHVLTNERGN